LAARSLADFGRDPGGIFEQADVHPGGLRSVGRGDLREDGLYPGADRFGENTGIEKIDVRRLQRAVQRSNLIINIRLTDGVASIGSNVVDRLADDDNIKSRPPVVTQTRGRCNVPGIRIRSETVEELIAKREPSSG
jgi:hypothetical protein